MAHRHTAHPRQKVLSPTHPIAANGSLRAQYAKQINRDYVTQKSLKSLDPEKRPAKGEYKLPHYEIPTPKSKFSEGVEVPTGRICIVGAGVAGLEIARLLKIFGKHDIDIFEATDRVGGRVYTFKFEEPACPHNYYDIGAMRLPHLDLMAPVFFLIGMLQAQGYLPHDCLKEYNLSDPRHTEPNMNCYQPISNATIGELLGPYDTAVLPIVQTFETQSFQDAFKDLVNTYDNISTREFLRTHAGMDYRTIETSETFDTGTGLFDQAFTETILDYVDFELADRWSRMDGGMHLLTDALEKAVAANNGLGGKGVPVQINSKVTAMTDLGSHIAVTVQKGETVETKEYSAVFNTTTLGCLQKIDISGLDLDKEVLTGIRVLGYDRSCKLAIKFRHNWWQDIALLGGASNTDLPVRTVVYPSWNDGPDDPAVLLASYTWAQDATRIGALIHNTDKEIEDKNDPVLVLALENLVKLFASTEIQPTLQQLKDLYISHHAFAWQQDPDTAGAFALFGPQQFKDMYPYMRNGYCDNKFFIAGEATSAHHAWIVGALDSAAFVVAKYFAANDKFEALAHLKASDQVSGGAGKLPEEFDEDVFLEQVKLGKKAKA